MLSNFDELISTSKEYISKVKWCRKVKMTKNCFKNRHDKNTRIFFNQQPSMSIILSHSMLLFTFKKNAIVFENAKSSSWNIQPLYTTKSTFFAPYEYCPICLNFLNIMTLLAPLSNLFESPNNAYHTIQFVRLSKK